jgi:hypothetical protein
MLELVAHHPELMWYVASVRAPSFPNLPPVKLVYRKLEDMIITMVNKLDIKWGFWDFETTEAGDRIYAHPCGAELFEAVCKLLEGTGVSALALQLWSDKANLTKRGNKTYYPLSCVKADRLHAREGEKRARAIRERFDAAASGQLKSCALASCGAKEAHVSHFGKCGSCKSVVYCCRDYQLADWPAHKAACKAARKAAAATPAASAAH